MTQRRGRPHARILDPNVLVESLLQGTRGADIAQSFNVTPAAVSQAIKALPKSALLTVVLGRLTINPAPLQPPRDAQPVDVMGVVRRVHEELLVVLDFLQSPAANTIKLGHRVQLRLATLERLLKWAQTFVETNRHLLDLMGVEVWLRQLQELLAEVDPSLRERLLERVQARGLAPGFLP
jgi:hypothetical protein